MADFLLSEAVEEDPTTNDDDEDEGNNNITLSDEEFIDDSNIDEQNASDYYGFTNVMREYDNTIQDSLEDFDYNQEASNYNSEISDLPRIDEFKDFESRVEKFKKTLINPQGLNNENSFFYSILYAIRYHLTKKSDTVDDEQIKVDIGARIYNKIYPLRSFLKLNLDVLSFDNQCHTINQILSENKLFLRIFELKDKF